jgi:hypothetical protein
MGGTGDIESRGLSGSTGDSCGGDGDVDGLSSLIFTSVCE